MLFNITGNSGSYEHLIDNARCNIGLIDQNFNHLESLTILYETLKYNCLIFGIPITN